uniref:Uncharacterized protein n=1 Tax=Fagus sylvatica TaxID=28930 RepID=A0A2N9F3G7_FAGSY
MGASLSLLPPERDWHCNKSESSHAPPRALFVPEKPTFCSPPPRLAAPFSLIHPLFVWESSVKISPPENITRALTRRCGDDASRRAFSSGVLVFSPQSQNNYNATCPLLENCGCATPCPLLLNLFLVSSVSVWCLCDPSVPSGVLESSGVFRAIRLF